MEIDFFESGLMTFCHDAKITFREIKRFHDLTESAWKQQDDDLQEFLSKELESIPEERHDDYISSYGQDLHENQTLFPNIHRFSIVISIHSYFEDTLNQLADILEKSVANAQKYKSFKSKFKGATIACAKAYIEKVGELDLAFLEANWEQIRMVNRLRNQLVHEAGFLPRLSDHDINKYVSTNEFLSGRLILKYQLNLCLSTSTLS
ncbi:hypothetical protein AB733_24140 [Photobacterium swingsii]|uniref:hypothetical protein n=1 Tax=Photobacterium swingsii TaxID=680026 RepID=UPI00066204BD|nr:hypothetical protein [Photobacterium swingsii]KMV28371.1 hypothetical protein AB733_24140 [Photobacterium swingsii]